MTLTSRLDAWSAGSRGPLLAALLALLAGLPGLWTLPPLDRDESRFAEASAQMLESGDFVSPHFQDAPRFKKPVGIYWLQAAAVEATQSLEMRAIWAYRLPSIFGAMAAAAACAWGAAAFLRPGQALVAGGLLGTTFLLSTEANIAATDAVLCGVVTTAMAALARMYLAGQAGAPISWRIKLVFWLTLAASVLVKGPVGPMVAGLTLLSLAAWDRKIIWFKDMGWGWGLVLMMVAVGPWAMAVTVATGGAFWGAAIGGDLVPKLLGDQEGHGAPPGFYAVLTPLLLFPATMLLPAGLAAGWRARAEPSVRFALCWLIPTWLTFEVIPTKLVHYTLPAYGALAWLMARALSEPIGSSARRIGAGLLLGGGLLFAGGVAAVLNVLQWWRFPSIAWAVVAAVLFLVAGVGGAVLLWRRQTQAALATAVAAAIAAHAVVIGALAPSLQPLWVANRAAQALTRAGLSPREGVVPGPVVVAGYPEPSLVFLLASDTVLGDAQDAADAIADGRPVIVEARQEAAFQVALTAKGRAAQSVGAVSGLDYSNNQRAALRLYRPARRIDARRDNGGSPRP